MMKNIFMRMFLLDAILNIIYAQTIHVVAYPENLTGHFRQILQTWSRKEGIR